VSTPRKTPGWLISPALHVGLLAASFMAFASAPKFEDSLEAVPVEVVTDSALNQIAKGEKTAPPAQKPALHAENPAAEPKQNPQEAKRDAPTPPPPLKRIADPSDEEAENKPPQEAAAPPKRIAALLKEKPTPAPPMRPQIKAEPEPVKEEPQEAEVVKPKPPEKPKLEKADAPTPPEKPKEKPRLKIDEVAKLLQQKKAADGKSGSSEKAAKNDNAAAKPKSGDETAPKSKFNAKNIATLLSHEAPQSASAGERTQLASLGAPTGAAPRMSASMQGKIDAYTVEHYRRCWATALSMNAVTYVPRVEFHLSRAGALEGAPRLLNPSSNPVERARGEQALDAVRRCSPMPVPAEFQPYYDYWRTTELDMKEDM